MLRLTKTASGETAEEVFLAHYSRLRGWALTLTNSDHERAEDLVHDAYIQFTFTRPDLNAIANLNGYLYTMLRNLHLSQVRRVERLQRRTLSIVDYDSAELGLRVIDPREQIRIQDELRRVCQFACIRKETSKAGSVLILRFLHGYYPKEIAQIMRTTRQGVEERLRTARNEARQYLREPRSLHFMRASSEALSSPPEMGFARTSDELLVELRHSIFNSRQGKCRPNHDLKLLYRNGDNAALDQETIAHIVSCRNCLDAVNALLNLPLLAERFPTDTLGMDKTPRSRDDGGDDAGGPSGGASATEVRICKKRAREVFEHRPAELCISVNGYLMAAQKVGSELSEQTVSINLPEKIEFIEVFGEQDIRLLFFSVDELPPGGAYSRSVQVELSDERMLTATLSFSNPWPTLQVTYSDPLMTEEGAGHEVETSALPATPVGENRERPRPRPQLGDFTLPVQRWLSNFAFWLRPGAVTAIIALILITSLVILRLRTPVVSAAELLQRSTLAEDAVLQNPALVLHRTINFEERVANDGQVVSRQRIEIWQSAARELKLRRLYNEQNNLIAGEWSRADGTSTVYRPGRAPEARTAPEVAPKAILETGELWRLDVSAKNFEMLVGKAQTTGVEERADSYVLTYSAQGDGSFLRASLTLNKDDLHATQQQLTIRSGDQVRQFNFVEAAFVQNAPGSVNENVFQPDPELLSPPVDKDANRGTNPANNDSTLSGSSGVVASHELEVEVTFLLNQIKANLGEQVSMSRTTGGVIQVEALVETEGRKAEMLSALGPVLKNPAVRIDIRTVAEAVKQGQKDSKPREGTVQEIEVANSRIPAESELRAYFSSRLVGNEAIEHEIDRYVTRAMSHSRQALLQASALKRLVERFSPEDMRALSPEARSRWLGMIKEHAQACRREVEALRQQLATIFGARGSSGEVGDVSTSIQAASRLVELSYANDEAVRSAFTISANGRATGGIKTDTFWRSLATVERLASVIESEYQK